MRIGKAIDDFTSRATGCGPGRPRKYDRVMLKLHKNAGKVLPVFMDSAQDLHRLRNIIHTFPARLGLESARVRSRRRDETTLELRLELDKVA